jgi:hypothetical protein
MEEYRSSARVCTWFIRLRTGTTLEGCYENDNEPSVSIKVGKLPD